MSDLIDREQAIEAINSRKSNIRPSGPYDEYSEGRYDAYEAAIDELGELPSAEKTWEWTLFRKRMPPVFGRYFITLDLGYVKNLVDIDVWDPEELEFHNYDINDVIAWMPIEFPEPHPEQYRKVTNESAD